MDFTVLEAGNVSQLIPHRRAQRGGDLIHSYKASIESSQGTLLF